MNVEHLHPTDASILRDCASPGCPQVVIGPAGQKCNDCEDSGCDTDACICETTESGQLKLDSNRELADRIGGKS